MKVYYSRSWMFPSYELCIYWPQTWGQKRCHGRIIGHLMCHSSNSKRIFDREISIHFLSSSSTFKLQATYFVNDRWIKMIPWTMKVWSRSWKNQSFRLLIAKVRSHVKITNVGKLRWKIEYCNSKRIFDREYALVAPKITYLVPKS